MGSPDWRRAQQVALPMVMPALAARTATGPRGPGSRRVLAAQALSWGGDLALLGAGRGRFLGGLTSFLAAHVAYTSALRTRSSEPILGTPGRRRFLAAGVAAASGMALAAGRDDRGLALPVAGYGVTLATMVAAAAAVDPNRAAAGCSPVRRCSWCPTPCSAYAASCSPTAPSTSTPPCSRRTSPRSGASVTG